MEAGSVAGGDGEGEDTVYISVLTSQLLTVKCMVVVLPGVLIAMATSTVR